MKKIKALFCIAMLSICLVGNAQANTTLTNAVSTFFGSVVDYVSTFVTGDDDCPLRICQQCKPGTLCRPKED